MAPSLGALSRSEEVLLFSGSLALMDSAIRMRNGSPETGPWAAFARKVGAEFSFAAIIVASTVEMVFRAVLIIPGAILYYVDSDRVTEDLKIMALSASVGGTIVSALNTLVAISALFENFRGAPLEYDEILPCVTSCVTNARPALEIAGRFMQGRASFWEVIVAFRSRR